jgi:hypothetical protein
MLRTNEVWFIIFAQSVDFWVKGAWFNTMAVGARLNVTQPTVPELINRTASATFADWFKPSPQLVSDSESVLLETQFIKLRGDAVSTKHNTLLSASAMSIPYVHDLLAQHCYSAWRVIAW